MRTKQEQEQLLKEILYLRYGKENPDRFDISIASYPVIAAHLGVSLKQVNFIAQKHFFKKEVDAPFKSKIEQKHIDYLVSEKTLKQQVLLTLRERVNKFNSLFKLDQKLTLYRLIKVYKQHKIKKKAKIIKNINANKYDP